MNRGDRVYAVVDLVLEFRLVFLLLRRPTLLAGRYPVRVGYRLDNRVEVCPVTLVATLVRLDLSQANFVAV